MPHRTERARRRPCPIIIPPLAAFAKGEPSAGGREPPHAAEAARGGIIAWERLSRSRQTRKRNSSVGGRPARLGRLTRSHATTRPKAFADHQARGRVFWQRAS